MMIFVLKRCSYSSCSLVNTLPSQHFDNLIHPKKINMDTPKIAIFAAGDTFSQAIIFGMLNFWGCGCLIFTIFQHPGNLTKQKKGSTGCLLQDAFPEELPSKGSALHAYRTWDLDGSFVCGV